MQELQGNCWSELVFKSRLKHWPELGEIQGGLQQAVGQVWWATKVDKQKGKKEMHRKYKGGQAAQGELACAGVELEELKLSWNWPWRSM